MQIDKPSATEHAEFLTLVDAEIRPDRAKTHAWEDFPLILHDANRENVRIARATDGSVAGGIACLIREFTTDYAPVAVAGIGSVVTSPAFRGQGISRLLQEDLLEDLRRLGVPLAVLWTRQPEIYSGRGFQPAGWEFHLDFRSADLPQGPGSGRRIRPLEAGDIPAVEALYSKHPFRTLRRAGDAAPLYGMPGTTGRVLEGPAGVEAAVFCGKGADFPGYVAEWDGRGAEVLHLLDRVREEGLADSILVPAGEESFAEGLVNRGAAWEIRTSGFWSVLDPSGLTGICGEGKPVGEAAASPVAWLGTVDAQGAIQPGVLKIGIWGFDSV